MTSPATANAVLLIHVLYVGVVVLGTALIALGGLCRWRWVHNLWFRLTHLAMILIVVAESLLGITCPLTVWERALRPDTAYEDSDFIASWLDRLLFYHFPHWVFTAGYSAFGLLVVSLLFLVPIRRPKAGRKN